MYVTLLVMKITCRLQIIIIIIITLYYGNTTETTGDEEPRFLSVYESFSCPFTTSSSSSGTRGN